MYSCSIRANIRFILFFQTQVGWIQHDFGHHSVFNSTKLNHIFQHFTIAFIKVSLQE